MMRIFLSSNKVDFSCTLIISIMLPSRFGFPPFSTKLPEVEISFGGKKT